MGNLILFFTSLKYLSLFEVHFRLFKYLNIFRCEFSPLLGFLTAFLSPEFSLVFYFFFQSSLSMGVLGLFVFVFVFSYMSPSLWDGCCRLYSSLCSKPGHILMTRFGLPHARMVYFYLCFLVHY